MARARARVGRTRAPRRRRRGVGVGGARRLRLGVVVFCFRFLLLPLLLLPLFERVRNLQRHHELGLEREVLRVPPRGLVRVRGQDLVPGRQPRPRQRPEVQGVEIRQRLAVRRGAAVQENAPQPGARDGRHGDGRVPARARDVPDRLGARPTKRRRVQTPQVVTQRAGVFRKRFVVVATSDSTRVPAEHVHVRAHARARLVGVPRRLRAGEGRRRRERARVRPRGGGGRARVFCHADPLPGGKRRREARVGGVRDSAEQHVRVAHLGGPVEAAVHEDAADHAGGVRAGGRGGHRRGRRRERAHRGALARRGRRARNRLRLRGEPLRGGVEVPTRRRARRGDGERGEGHDLSARKERHDDAAGGGGAVLSGVQRVRVAVGDEHGGARVQRFRNADTFLIRVRRRLAAARLLRPAEVR